MLANLPTPLEHADRLGEALGLERGRLWLKREDLTGLATGGNKARKLELLVGDAMARGCDVLVTAGGVQSNHARMTAAAAARVGLGCVLAFNSDPPPAAGGMPASGADDVAEGNQLIELLVGAERRFAGPMGLADLNGVLTGIVEELRATGRRPYEIPVGGSNALGASAYAAAAGEIVEQLGHDDVVVVTATGSGGTQAGLAARLGHERVLGVDVGAMPDVASIVRDLAIRVAALTESPAPTGEPWVLSDQVGAGYGAPTDACLEAIRLAARTEGLLLDPVYSGKALAGLIGLVRSGGLAATTLAATTAKAIVFLATGGTPALFTSRYAGWLAS